MNIDEQIQALERSITGTSTPTVSTVQTFPQPIQQTPTTSSKNAILKRTAVGVLISTLLLVTFRPIWLYSHVYDSTKQEVESKIQYVKTFVTIILLSFSIFLCLCWFNVFN